MSGFGNFLAGAQAGRQALDRRRDDQKTNRLQELSAGIVDGDPNAFAQAAAIDPKRAGEYQDAGDSLVRRASGAASYVMDAVKRGNPAEVQGRYNAVKPFLARLGGQQGMVPPDTFDESMIPRMEEIIGRSQGLGGEKQQRNLAVSPGSAIVDPETGQLIYERPFAPAKESWTVVNVPDGRGGMEQMERNPNTGEWREPQYPGEAPQVPMQSAPQSGGGPMVLDDALAQAVMQQESGGDPNAVSSAGARGLMQIMPETARDPGFGIQPMRDGSPEENVRIGRDYLQAMLQKYGGNQQLALAAYNGGPGRVDSALQRAGGDPQKAMQFLPAETQAYPGAVQARLGGNSPQIAQAGSSRRGYTPPKSQNKAPPAGYTWSADRSALEMIPGGPAQVSNDARADAAAARKVADELKANAKAQQSQARQAETTEAANSLVASIDALTASPGFSALGTEWGDVQIGTPIVRNDAKDAHAQLQNIGGKVALATMARLKNLSSSGATGFGALSAPELTLLQNALAALQSEKISNKQLVKSLKTVRDSMDQVATWKDPNRPLEGAASPSNDIDGLLGKYGIN